MSRFTFRRGQWEDGSALPEWQNDEEFDAYLRRIGYTSSKISIGSEYSAELEIYESSDGSSFYANVSPSGGSCYEVFLPDFPSLMIFLKDLAPAFSGIAMNNLQQELSALHEKFFQLYHGHSALNICEKCDPEGWKKLADMRQANRESRKKEA